MSSRELARQLEVIGEPDAQLFIGYPIIGAADGKHPIDALYVSPTKGLVVFDLVDGRSLDDYDDRQDDAATKLTARLLTYRDLVQKRERRLLIPIHTITFAPGVTRLPDDEDYMLANVDDLDEALNECVWDKPSMEVFERTLSALQNISTIRRARATRVTTGADTLGARLQHLENSIATLDGTQGKAVLETVVGVQRIRGLAGSGKTIVLALKTAYLHAQHPEWNIVVTFQTRSLKQHFMRLINAFTIESTGDEPDWTRVKVVHAWGAPGGGNRDGIYHQFCVENGVQYLDFNAAKARYGARNALQGACATALSSVPTVVSSYDAVLVDEAQDLPPSFLRMCYEMLTSDHRLVYAYDELQTLNGQGLPPAEEIFGQTTSGEPRVTLEGTSYDLGARRDIILEKCYRNSRPVLVTAHALGFGTYRTPERPGRSGLVQIFDQSSLWREIGYRVVEGDLVEGKHVALARTNETSPAFLETHSSIDELIQFEKFETQQEQAEWVAGSIKKNLEEDDLRFDDIIVINTDPFTTRSNVGPVRRALFERGIPSHTAGVDDGPDVFFRPGANSITCTGIYRAKGNEAGMVYIIDADECYSTSASLASVRNRLFTAITRSKAWVRVTGIGEKMQLLTDEYEAVKDANFELRFRYPTEDERKQLEILHRDMTPAEQKMRASSRSEFESILQNIEQGALHVEDFDEETLNRFSELLRQRRQNDE